MPAGRPKAENPKTNVLHIRLTDTEFAEIENLAKKLKITKSEVICLRSDMTPDLEEIKNKVAEIIPEKYLPEFVKFSAKDMQELALLGEMILSLEELERRK